MKILISIDDTDDIGTKGTGEILEELCAELEKEFGAVCSRVTRHQLLIHRDIKYTSHNSSMCCECITDAENFEKIVEISAAFLKENCAANSDPGLCMVNVDDISSDNIGRLISWGRKAKTDVLKKEDAVKLAADTKIHLSEHGGSGEGIIGALAGAGLRLTGSDGRFKGKFDLEAPEGYLTVKEVCNCPFIDQVLDSSYESVAEDQIIYITDKIKTVLHNNRSALIVKKNSEGNYTNLTRKELKEH